MLTFYKLLLYINKLFFNVFKNNDRNQEINIKSRKHEIHPHTRENGRYQKNS